MGREKVGDLRATPSDKAFLGKAGGESKSEEASPGSVLTLPFSWSTVDPSCCKPLWQQAGWA